MDTGNNKTLTKSVETKIWFRKMTIKEIDAYIKSKEPLDKAGAYAIQGKGSLIVRKIEGDYLNVVGLPLCSLMESLQKLGVYV